MVSVFLEHSWKKLSRSESFGKELATTIFLGFIALMMVVYSLALGFALNSIITKALKISDSISFLNGLLIYYFGFEFMLRYFMQSIPVLDVQPYLHLPVRKSTITHYLLGRSALHVLNIFVLLLFTPFTFQVIAPLYGTGTAWSWLISLWMLSLTINYLVVLFKKRLDDSVWGLIIILSVFLLFGASDYYGWFRMSDVSASFFKIFIARPSFVAAPGLLLLFLYIINYRFYKSSLYAEEIVIQKESSSYKFSRDLTFLRNFGMIGDWINIEVKLILRNKRPRSMLFLSAFFLLYGLIFYTNEKYTSMSSFFIFIGIFITGIFMINYGQFLFSWQGGHFDFTMTQPVSIRQYVESKYYLLCSVSIACFLISIPYVYFGWQFLFIHAATCLFNIGINVFFIMNIAMWGPKKIDLTKGSIFNYEGIGAAQWMMGIPTLVLPYVFYLPFSLSGHPNFGLLAVAIVGLIGIALNKPLLNLTARRLLERKYTIAAGFRKE